jgi:beta-aspartyl-peptidase (threonine type)
MNEFAFAIHGGAGVIDPANFAPDRRQACAAALRGIAERAVAALAAGRAALDVVEQAVVELEDCEYFNAGYGAVLNGDGEVELDAALMDGATRAAGAVASARRTRNPVRAARAVLDDGEHVLLIGAGADAFAAARGVECVDPAWFVTDERRVQLAAAQAEGRVSLDHDERYRDDARGPAWSETERKSGTVGAVARDRAGHLAAATSTGGMTNKRPGRVGDAPLIGAGTFADDASCAVSATGHGEYYIRRVLAHDVHARIAYAGATLAAAADAALAEVGRLGGTGGLIAVGRDGDAVLPFNSPGMYRAWYAGGRVHVGIYADPETD